MNIEAFIDRVNLVLVLDHAGRAGNGFFLSLFDQHPEVITCPWVHYNYSYLITEFGVDQELEVEKARRFLIEKSYFRYLYNDMDERLEWEVRKCGGDPGALIDRELLRDVFDGYLTGKSSITRRELVLASYFSYAVATNRDVERLRYVLISDSISLRTEGVREGFSGKVVDYIVADFPSSKLVHLVRDPRAGLASSTHQFINSLGNMYGIRAGNYWARFSRLVRRDFDWDSVFVFGFWLMYFAQTFVAAERKKREFQELFFTVRNEDLNIRFKSTVRSLCDWIGVCASPQWQADDYVPTMVGVPWTGTGAYNSQYQKVKFGPLKNDSDEIARTVTGPNEYVTRRWRTRLLANEKLIIEYALHRELQAYGYEQVELNRGRWCDRRLFLALVRPLSGEFPTFRWLLLGRKVGMGEVFQRVFYVFSFPLFYVASRVIIWGALTKGDEFRLTRFKAE